MNGLRFAIASIIALALLTIGISIPAYSREKLPGKDWAVVIGINDYKRVSPRLKFAVADAQAVGNLLEEYGYRVTRIENTQATRDRILTELGTELPKRVGPNDRVLIYFSGHGQDLPIPGGGLRGFLLPADTDPIKLDATAISMVRVRELAGALPAKHVLFLIDACYGGIAGQTTKAPTPVGTIRLKQIMKEPGRWLITAGGPDQEALEVADWGHSLFTNVFLKGVGKDRLADLNGDGVIPGSELYIYLEDRVFDEGQMRGHNQRPEFWSLSGYKGEFVFVPPETDRSKDVQPGMAFTGWVIVTVEEGLEGWIWLGDGLFPTMQDCIFRRANLIARDKIGDSETGCERAPAQVFCGEVRGDRACNTDKRPCEKHSTSGCERLGIAEVLK